MNKKYTEELKLQVVKEYLAGSKASEIVKKYELRDRNRIFKWRDQYLKYGYFPDGCGKASCGRPRKIDTSQMSKDEYIAYLEMENEILKQLSSLNNNPSK